MKACLSVYFLFFKINEGMKEDCTVLYLEPSGCVCFNVVPVDAHAVANHEHIVLRARVSGLLRALRAGRQVEDAKRGLAPSDPVRTVGIMPAVGTVAALGRVKMFACLQTS